MDFRGLKRRSFLTAFSTAPLAFANGAADDDKAVRTLLGQLNAAWNRHDIAAFAALFEEDGTVITPTGTWWRGRAEIERELGALHRNLLKNSRVSATVKEIRMIQPGVALVQGIGEDDTGLTGPDGRKLPAGHALFTYVLLKRNRAWRVASDQLTLLPEKRS